MSLTAFLIVQRFQVIHDLSLFLVSAIHHGLDLPEITGPYDLLYICKQNVTLTSSPPPDMIEVSLSTKQATPRHVLPPALIRTLDWWMDCGNVCAGIPFVHLSPTVTVVINASLIGWGSHMEGTQFQRAWSEHKENLYMNVLKLWVIQSFLDFLLPSQGAVGADCHWKRHCSAQSKQMGWGQGVLVPDSSVKKHWAFRSFVSQRISHL